MRRMLDSMRAWRDRFAWAKPGQQLLLLVGVAFVLLVAITGSFLGAGALVGGSPAAATETPVAPGGFIPLPTATFTAAGSPTATPTFPNFVSSPTATRPTQGPLNTPTLGQRSTRTWAWARIIRE